MRNNSTRIGIALALIAAVVAVGSEASAAPTTRSPGEFRRCSTITGWTEQTISFSYIGTAAPFPIHKVGDALVYHDLIFGADGATIGSAVGYVEAVSIAPNGHIWTTYVESSQTPDGTWTATGRVDRTAMLTSTGLARLELVGTGGAYAGEHGTLQWKIEQVPPANASVKVDLTIDLCR